MWIEKTLTYTGSKEHYFVFVCIVFAGGGITPSLDVLQNMAALDEVLNS